MGRPLSPHIRGCRSRGSDQVFYLYSLGSTYANQPSSKSSIICTQSPGSFRRCNILFYSCFIKIDPSYKAAYLIKKYPIQLNFHFLSFVFFFPLYSFFTHTDTHIHKELPFSSTLLVQITSIKQMSSFLSLKLFSLGFRQSGY